MDPLHFINCQHSPAYVIYERFTLAQRWEAIAVTRRGLSSKVHLAAHMVRRDYPAAGFGRQALDR
jgi:hypothetical protein